MAFGNVCANCGFTCPATAPAFLATVGFSSLFTGGSIKVTSGLLSGALCTLLLVISVSTITKSESSSLLAFTGNEDSLLKSFVGAWAFDVAAFRSATSLFNTALDRSWRELVVRKWSEGGPPTKSPSRESKASLKLSIALGIVLRTRDFVLTSLSASSEPAAWKTPPICMN